MYTEEYIRENVNEVKWDRVSYYIKLSESFIREYENRVDWRGISQSQELSESFIKEFKNKINWSSISFNQKLSESFIREFKDKLDWLGISFSQKLSESFIKEFQNRIYWNYISLHRKLSESFIKEFQNKVDWYVISSNQKLSKSFIEEFKDKINIDIQLKTHHQTLTYQQKLGIAKDYARKYDLKCNSRYLYAYRCHNKFNHGMYSRTISYDNKGVYKDWHCNLDCTCQNSFGLGIFPMGNIKVRIKIKDIGCWAKNTNKLRVWAFEII